MSYTTANAVTGAQGDSLNLSSEEPGLDIKNGLGTEDLLSQKRESQWCDATPEKGGLFPINDFRMGGIGKNGTEIDTFTLIASHIVAYHMEGQDRLLEYARAVKTKKGSEIWYRGRRYKKEYHRGTAAPFSRIISKRLGGEIILQEKQEIIKLLKERMA